MIYKSTVIVSILTIFLFGRFSLFAQEVIKIDFSVKHQQIDGFGASSAWHGRLSDKEFDVAYGNGDNQLGLSILRLRIDPGGKTMWADELANAKKAIARGATVFATPWTPPASLKTNNSNVGGELAPAYYQDYVDYLNSFIDYMEENKAPLCAISLQNEPNIKVTYESCFWSPAQFLEFCTYYAGDIKAPVMMPEAFNFDFAFSDPVLKDSVAASHIEIIGGHLYGASPKNYPLAAEKGKKVWMTEKFMDPEDIVTCLSMAKEISDCMTSNMNAYIWWWLRQPSCNLISSGGASIKKKGYVMAQFSKFVRPGYYRTATKYNVYQGMSITAYTGEKQVVVAVNRNTKPKTVQFELSGDSVKFLKKYVTSATKNLKMEGTVEVIDHKFSIELEPQSIVTFVGTDEAISPVGVNSNRFNGEISIYPNPSVNGQFKLNLELPSVDDLLNLEILNLEGKIVFDKHIEDNVTEVETNLRPGVYVIRLAGREYLYHQKLVIK